VTRIRVNTPLTLQLKPNYMEGDDPTLQPEHLQQAGGLRARPAERKPASSGRDPAAGSEAHRSGVTPGRFRVTFAVDRRRTMFDVTTGSVQNPFRLKELQ